MTPSTSAGPHFAVGSAIFGEIKPADVAFVAAQGFPAMELYRSGFSAEFLQRPQGFKDLLDQHGLRMITCSNGGPGMSTNFIDPAKKAQTIADHIAFARDVLSLFGCQHFKMNMGSRPPKGTSISDLQAIASTLNELGRATLDMGIKLSPIRISGGLSSGSTRFAS